MTDFSRGTLRTNCTTSKTAELWIKRDFFFFTHLHILRWRWRVCYFLPQNISVFCRTLILHNNNPSRENGMTFRRVELKTRTFSHSIFVWRCCTYFCPNEFFLTTKIKLRINFSVAFWRRVIVYVLVWPPKCGVHITLCAYLYIPRETFEFCFHSSCKWAPQRIFIIYKPIITYTYRE